MANVLDQSNIPYPDFQNGSIISEAEFDANNAELQSKLNLAIAQVNTNSADVETGDSALTTHKASNDHDSRYYTEAELDAGQLDNRYYTETEVDSAIAVVQADVDQNEADADAAIAAVQADVDANELASNNAIAAVQADVDANEIASDAADVTLQNNIDAEAALRNSGDINLQNQITSNDADIALRALDSAVVHDTGNETIAGEKTFTSSPLVPNATANTGVVNKQQAEQLIDDAMIGELPGESVNGKTYSESIFTTGDVDTADVQGLVKSCVAKGRTLVNQFGKYADIETLDFVGGISVASLELVDDSFVGSKSVKATAVNATDTRTLSFAGEDSFYIEPDTHYLVQANIKAVVGEHLFRVRQIDGGGATVREEVSANTTSNVNGFVTIYKKFKSELTSDRIICLGDATAIHGSALFDGFSLYEISESEYNDLTDAELLDRYPFIDGIQSVENPVVESVGVNLLNEKSLIKGGYYSNSNGSFQTDAISYYPSEADRIVVEGKTTLYVNSFVLDFVRIAFFDSFGEFISGFFHNSLTESAIAIPDNAYEATVCPDEEAIFNTVVAFASQSTYQEYKQSSLQAFTTIRSLPNGTEDIVDMVTGDGVREVYPWTVSDGDLNTSMTTSRVNVDILFLLTGGPLKTALIDLGYFTNAINLEVLFEDRPQIASGDEDTTANIGSYLTNVNGDIGFVFSKGTTLDDAKSQVIGKILQYQLATPETFKAGIEGTYEAFPNGTSYNSSDTFFAELDVEYGINAAAQINRNTRTITQLAEEKEATHSEKKTYFPFNVLRTPTDAKGIPYSMVGTGLTLQNMVENGNFADGTNEWSTQIGVSSFTVSSNTASFTATAAGGRIVNNIGTVTEDDVWFVYAQVKASTNLVQLSINGVEPLATTSGSGDYEELYKKNSYDFPTAVNSLVFIRDLASSGWSQVDVRNVHAINMTALNIEHYTEAQMLELVRGGYINGLKSASIDLDSAGVNLIPFFYEGQGVDATNGDFGDNSARARTEFISIEGGRDYYLSNCDPIAIAYYDGDKNFLEGVFPFDVGVLNPPDGTLHAVFSVNNAIDFSEAMLNKGSTALPYVPHTSSPVKSSYELASLPNGVADTVDFKTGKKVKRIKKYTITSDDVSLATVQTNTSIYYIQLPDTITGSAGSVSGDVLLEYSFEVPSSASDDVESIGGFYEPDNDSRLRYMTVTGQDLATTQAELEGRTVYYQLATPIVEDIDLTGLLNPYKDGQITNDPLLRLDIEWTTNLEGRIEELEKILHANNRATEKQIPELLNGWENFGGEYETASYYKDDSGVVHLNGMVKSGTITSGTDLFLLKEGYRPASSQPFETIGDASTPQFFLRSTGYLEIRTADPVWTSLNGISFLAEQ